MQYRLTLNSEQASCLSHLCVEITDMYQSWDDFLMLGWVDIYIESNSSISSCGLFWEQQQPLTISYSVQAYV